MACAIRPPTGPEACRRTQTPVLPIIGHSLSRCRWPGTPSDSVHSPLRIHPRKQRHRRFAKAQTAREKITPRRSRSQCPQNRINAPASIDGFAATPLRTAQFIAPALKVYIYSRWRCRGRNSAYPGGTNGVLENGIHSGRHGKHIGARHQGDGRATGDGVGRTRSLLSRPRLTIGFYPIQ